MLVVETPALRLTYDRKPFSKEGLTIVVKGVPDSQFNTWPFTATIPKAISAAPHARSMRPTARFRSDKA